MSLSEAWLALEVVLVILRHCATSWGESTQAGSFFDLRVADYSAFIFGASRLEASPRSAESVLLPDVK